MTFGRTFTKSLRFSLVCLLMGLGIVTMASAAPETPSGILTYVETEFNEPGLDAPRSIAVSPDSQNVYVTGLNDDSVATFRRQSDGRLLLIDVDFDGVTLADGLNGATGVTVSPDGKHVYVASNIDHAVAVFSRNSVHGGLTYVEAKKDGAGGVDGLYGACSVVVSPDGKHVYVTGYSESAVAIFGRNSTSGVLTYKGMVQDGVGGVEGLHGARSVDISADGDHLYVASVVDDAVAVFNRNSTTGLLTFEEWERDNFGGVSSLDGAYSVAVRGTKVYVVGNDDHAVTIFERNDSTGRLIPLTEAIEGVNSVDGLSDPIAVAISPDGHYCYATGSADDAVVTLQYIGGSYNFFLYRDTVKDGVGGVDGLNYAYAVAVSPDGNYLYATGSIDDAVAIFARDSSTGALTYLDMVNDVGGLEHPVAVAVSPDGKHVYAVSDYYPGSGSDDDNAIAVFARNGGTGKLTFVEYLEDNVGGVDGLASAKGVVVSPDGKHVYTSAYNDDAVGIFGRNSSTGKLTYLGMVQDRTGDPEVDGLDGANGIAISPDGVYVYATGHVDDALAFFRRNATTGLLTYAGVLKDGDYGTTDGLDGAYAVAASPDGKHVYVASEVDDAVAFFEWGTTSHGFPVLTYEGMKKDGVGPVNGLNGARGVAVSADGEHVYVVGYEEHALADFTRNSITGDLTFHKGWWDGGGGVDGLRNPTSVAVHPVTNHIFVVGYGDSALAVFERDSASGEPVYLGMEENEVNGVKGFIGPRAVTVSPDGRHLYATTIGNKSLVVFAHGRSVIYLPVVVRDF